MQQLNGMALAAKAAVHDAERAIEQARQQLARAQQEFAGALRLLANGHGMSDAKITADFARIVAL